MKAILQDIGYVTKYTKSEDFYSIIEKRGAFEFIFKMSLKWRAIELIWYTKYDNKLIPFSDSWSGMASDLLGEHIPVPLPIFKDYNELKEILTIVCEKYEEYKSAFLSAVASEEEWTFCDTIPDEQKPIFKDSFFFFAQWQGYNYWLFDCAEEVEDPEVLLFAQMKIQPTGQSFTRFVYDEGLADWGIGIL